MHACGLRELVPRAPVPPTSSSDTFSTTLPTKMARWPVRAENALKHLNALRDESGRKTLLRMGVKSGGCGGMSYVMDFEEEGNVKVGPELCFP